MTAAINNIYVSAKTNNTATATKSKAVKASPQQEALALLKELRNLIFKEYGIKLQLRDSRISTKIGHAAREKLGLDIAAQVKKKGGNKKFDWQKWNSKLFPKLFGQPDALKYAPEVVAIFMSMLYDTISKDPEQAIADLVEFYKAAKARFDKDKDFEEASRQEVVQLQGGNKQSIAAWQSICSISRNEFQQIYDRYMLNFGEFIII